MKMYKREEEVDGLVVDPLKAIHQVSGVTAKELCHYFFIPGMYRGKMEPEPPKWGGSATLINRYRYRYLNKLLRKAKRVTNFEDSTAHFFKLDIVVLQM